MGHKKTGIQLYDSFVELFCSRKFELHRIGGLLYLIQYFLSWHFYLRNYDFYKDSFLAWSLPLTGILQSFSASYYFRFLHTRTDPGYYNNSGALSYSFVVENIFFAGLLLFQCLYMNDNIKPYIPFIIENIMVFLPYCAVRPIFPKTRFRDSYQMKENNWEQAKKRQNATFFYYATRITKMFYVWAKHYIGFFLNYVRFADGFTAPQLKHLHLLLIISGFPTTISMFLHTLAFKHHITKKTSYIVYTISFMATFYGFYGIMNIFTLHLDLVLITFIGLVINFSNRKVQWAWQIIVMVLLNLNRQGYFALSTDAVNTN